MQKSCETRAKKAGDAAETQRKLEAKYDIEQERQCRYWIDSVLGENLSEKEGGMYNFAQSLKDGQILCKLLNKLSEETGGAPLIKKINAQKMAFKQMENIEQFLKGCITFGLKAGDCFQTADLYEAQNMSQVLQTIYAVSSAASSIHKYAGECIGTKLSEGNERDFDEATLKAGQNILGAQMGAFKGESQAGMNIGKARKVCD